MRHSKTALFSAYMAAWLAVCATCSAAEFDLAKWGIRYELKRTGEPRPLRIHSIRVDLTSGRTEPKAILALDPDGDGPAEAALTSPLTLVKDRPVLAFVNACPWDSFPDAGGNRDRKWYEGQPVDIDGLAAADGAVRSPSTKNTCAVWRDAGGTLHIGVCTSEVGVVEGVAGFLQILRDGEIVVKPNANLAPRTSIGLDRDKRYLWLVVVDGRQRGYSEGMSYEEVAKHMATLGCWDAAGMDGGGSSIMGLMSTDEGLVVVNSPSDRTALGRAKIRPLPLVLSIRARKETNKRDH